MYQNKKILKNIKDKVSKYLRDCFGVSGKEHLLKDANIEPFSRGLRIPQKY